MAHISDIKLIRTDTTLDLSQKAEKTGISFLETHNRWAFIPVSLDTRGSRLLKKKKTPVVMGPGGSR
uniref:Uncharacterized protein n=1 Tax=Aegilops tauschii subsp. strangulata TaxID=200361 RepID=A0A453GDQ5_AEGTS